MKRQGEKSQSKKGLDELATFSDFVRAASTVLPEVPKPARKPSLTERFIWTGIALAIFLVMSQTSLYGVPQGLSDQFAMARVIFASSQGTLMELGIGPIVTAGLILQLMKGAEMIKLDFKKPEDRSLFTSATKLLTILVTLMEALALMLGGAFGPNLPFLTFTIILVQLFSATLMVQLLDELVQKGWGIGSGISLFILAGVAQTVVWNIFSPIQPSGQYLGIAFYGINATLAGHPQLAFFREGSLPSIFSLILTIVVMLVIIYIEGMRIEIPITSTRFRGFSGVHPIKLLYVSNVPVILTSALLANVMFFSQMVWSRLNPLNDNLFLNWFVTFDRTQPGRPTGGLVHFITSPGTPAAAFGEPLRALSYVAFMVIFAVIFAKLWVGLGGLSPKAVAKSLVDAKVQVPGFRRAEVSIETVLNRYIPSVTILGGVIVGLLASLGDLLGAFGSGVGLLLMIDITIQYYMLLTREHLENIMPRLGGILGTG